MTQNDKELLIRDLCARLPYGVIVHLKYDENTSITREMGLGSLHDIMFDCAEGKPYLRPMSSMTEEEEKEFIKILDLEMEALSAPEGHTIASAASSTFEIDFYNKHHFDYRGLIEKGLAIEVTKENNPYKN